MKKIISIILSLSFLVIMCTPANAATHNKINDVTIISQPTDQATQYAISEYQSMLKSHCYFNGTSDHLTAKLGSGFRVDNSSENTSVEYYLFPIFINNDVKYMYRVYKYNGEFTGIISELLAEEFNDVITKSDKPLAFIESEENIVAISELDYKIVAESNAQKQPNINRLHEDQCNYFFNERKSNNQIYVKVNPYEVISSSFEQNQCSKTTPRYTGILTIDYLEDQTTKPWCAAYVTANILRFMTGDSSILSQTIADFGNVADTDSFSLTTLQSFSAEKGISMGGYVNNEIDPYRLYSNLRERKPVYLAMDDINSNSNHAVVLHGVYDNNYYVRNPWYQKSETYTYGGYYYPYNNSSKIYDPFRHILFSY